MKIALKKLTLRNFRGVHSESFVFTENETFIHGANGTGKTTLFDAFIWSMFGKDHQGKQDNQLKTFDKAGKTADKAECEVEAILSIDGKETILRRVYAENWVKPRGEEFEIFKDNETRYHVNNVKVSKGEYDRKVAEWCNETVFKSITNPAYFPNLSKDEQRRLLYEMVGGITDADIAGDNESFKQVLLDTTGVTFEAYKKVLAAKKAPIKDDLIGIPERIDELKRKIVVVPDYDLLTADLLFEEAKMTVIEGSLGDVATRSENENNKRLEIQQGINNLELENQRLLNLETAKKTQSIATLEAKIVEIENKSKTAVTAEATRKEKVAALEKQKVEKQSELAELRKEWVTVNAEQLVFVAGAFECPACKRALEMDDIEAKQTLLTNNFNVAKALKVEGNKKKGKAVNVKIAEIEAAILAISEPIKAESFQGSSIQVLKEQIEELKNSTVVKPSLVVDNERAIVIQKGLLTETAGAGGNSTVSIIEEKNALQLVIDELKKKLALKDEFERTNTRIDQLEKQFKSLNKELSILEKKEFALKSFEFSKSTEYQTRINEMFEFTKFKLFNQQVDGTIVPTFECMVDGVPYSVLNNAMQVGAGFDIINTISKHSNTFAPIWVDNRESVSWIPEMETQIINLVVDIRAKILTERTVLLAQIKAEEEAAEKARVNKL